LNLVFRQSSTAAALWAALHQLFQDNVDARMGTWGQQRKIKEDFLCVSKNVSTRFIAHDVEKKKIAS
jgi:hypothetical protein